MADTLYGYVRGSTDDVDLENQYRLLLEYGVSPERIYSDASVSGVVTPQNRGGWSRLDGVLESTDKLAVTELQRIGRNR